jgi:hypothetical protein
VAATDAAGANVAAGIGLLKHAFSAASAPDGAAVESTTQAGVARLEQTDESNAEALRAVAQNDRTQWV